MGEPRRWASGTRRWASGFGGGRAASEVGERDSKVGEPRRWASLAGGRASEVGERALEVGFSLHLELQFLGPVRRSFECESSTFFLQSNPKVIKRNSFDGSPARTELKILSFPYAQNLDSQPWRGMPSKPFILVTLVLFLRKKTRSVKFKTNSIGSEKISAGS